MRCLSRVRSPFVFQRPIDGNFSPRSVNWSTEIEQPLGSRIKLQLRYLRNESSGLVIAERQGQAIYYELNTSVFQDLIQHLVGWMKPLGQTAAARRRAQEA